MSDRKMSKHATDTDEERLDESVWKLVLTLNKMAERERGREGAQGWLCPYALLIILLITG